MVDSVSVINILQNMFPKEVYYISSNRIPRFNIRINPLVYLGIGDGSDKESLIKMTNYEIMIHLTNIKKY